jgi:glutamate--cysteine ligase
VPDLDPELRVLSSHQVRFLTALRGIAESGRTPPAEEKLELFHGRWRGSVDPVFAEFAY